MSISSFVEATCEAPRRDTPRKQVDPIDQEGRGTGEPIQDMPVDHCSDNNFDLDS